MVLLLRDDLILETFDSPDAPPDWIEWIDVENDEYAFCSDAGQRFRGELIKAEGFFHGEQWRLIPDGSPALENALALVDRASDVDPRRCSFANLADLRHHLTSRIR
jgi:hypothetical protein